MVLISDDVWQPWCLRTGRWFRCWWSRRLRTDVAVDAEAAAARRSGDAALVDGAPCDVEPEVLYRSCALLGPPLTLGNGPGAEAAAAGRVHQWQ